MHAERGPESFDLCFRMLAGHDRFHLAQAKRALEAVVPEELSGRVGDGWYADLMQRSDAHPGPRMGVSRSLRLFRG